MLRNWNFNIDIDLTQKDEPMYRQIADKVREQILRGALRPGEALPGSREMAELLGVSRKTVITAMDQLIFGGWLENRERVGLFVAQKLPVTHDDAAEPVAPTHIRLHINDGFPDTQLMPFEELSRAYRQTFNRTARWKMMGYTDPAGYPAYRHALSQQLSQSRGLPCTENEICVTRGSQQALYLTAHALMHSGDTIAVEWPCYPNALAAFASAGLNVVHIPVDDDGIIVDQLASHPEVRAVYVTPRYQYPTTVTLSAKRRKELAHLATERDMLVIEDDFGANFQFQGRPLMPLCTQLSMAHSVYIGTSSKILAPALRMGFIATSADMVRRIAEYRHLIDIQGDNIMERAIMSLLENGDVQRHLKRAARTYSERLDYLAGQITRRMPDGVTFHHPHGGLAVWIGLPGQGWHERLLACGIDAPVFTLADGSEGVRIGYASLQKEEMALIVDVIQHECIRLSHHTQNS